MGSEWPLSHVLNMVVKTCSERAGFLDGPGPGDHLKQAKQSAQRSGKHFRKASLCPWEEHLSKTAAQVEQWFQTVLDHVGQPARSG